MGFLTNWRSGLCSPEGGWSSLTPHGQRTGNHSPDHKHVQISHHCQDFSTHPEAGHLFVRQGLKSVFDLTERQVWDESIIYSYSNRQVMKSSWDGFIVTRVRPAELEPGKVVFPAAVWINKIFDCNAVGSIWTLTLPVYFNAQQWALVRLQERRDLAWQKEEEVICCCFLMIPLVWLSLCCSV